jgi:hypothetical protein
MDSKKDSSQCKDLRTVECILFPMEDSLTFTHYHRTPKYFINLEFSSFFCTCNSTQTFDIYQLFIRPFYKREMRLEETRMEPELTEWNVLNTKVRKWDHKSDIKNYFLEKILIYNFFTLLKSVNIIWP